jgi:hypothetical protein
MLFLEGILTIFYRFSLSREISNVIDNYIDIKIVFYKLASVIEWTRSLKCEMEDGGR